MIDELVLMLLRRKCDDKVLRHTFSHASTGDNRPPAPFHRRGSR
uniref:Uncharacterized protein n=1 Tax=Arundo donax TaxID=35708 RepID=A0A0A8YB47_ARUDO